MPECAPSTMSPLRRWIINGFILGLLGLTVTATVLQKEAWPFCNYGMFDWICRWGDTTAIEFYTVQDGEEKRLRTEDGLMGNLHVVYAYARILDKSGWQSHDAKVAMGLLLRDLRHRPFGPPSLEPEAVRVYQVQYHYPQTDDPSPEVREKTLLLEVERETP